MTKAILFNEEEEFIELPSIKDAAEYLGTTVQKVSLAAKVNHNKIKNYYVELEEDRIVQYHFRQPIRIWDDIDVIGDTLLIHPTAIKKSLKSECVSALHFKYFSHTKGRKI